MRDYAAGTRAQIPPGAHFRSDRPQAADPARAYFTCATLKGETIAVATEPVAFTRVKPGKTLIAAKNNAAV